MTAPATSLSLLLLLLLCWLACSTHGLSTVSPGDNLVYYELLATPRLQRLPRRPPAFASLHRRTPGVKSSSALAAALSGVSLNVSASSQSATSRHIEFDDSFRISVSAYNRTFYLHLDPDDHMVHPEAEVVTHHGDGTVERKLLRPLVRVYSGSVYESHAHSEYQWELRKAGAESAIDFGRDDGMLSSLITKVSGRSLADLPIQVAGKARLVLHHDGHLPDETYSHHYPLTDRPIFYAHFSVGSETYRVSPIHVYKQYKHDADPMISSISSRPTHLKDSTMVIYRNSDTVAALKKRDTTVLSETANVVSCGSDSLNYNRNLSIRALTSKSSMTQLFKRQTSSDLTSGCPTDLKFVYMGVAADCAYSKSFSNSEKDIITELIDVWSQSRYIYETTFRVGLGIQTLNIRMECGTEAWNVPCSTAYTIQKRLSDFSAWRGAQSSDEGLWHLMSDCPTPPTVGIAWSSTICDVKAKRQSNANGGIDSVSGTAVSTKTRVQWKVVAHEIGHNFGAIHDCTSTTCSATGSTGNSGTTSGISGTGDDIAASCEPCGSSCDCKQEYLMNPTDTAILDQFSDGSVTRICHTLGEKLRSPQLSQCLLLPGARKTFQGNVCGNGIKEAGEQCDCGSRCTQDNCCTTDCKFKGTAKCSDRNSPGCCLNCQVQPANRVCRPSQDVCDPAETCDGIAPDCPTDQFLDNGVSCALNSTIKLPSGSDTRTYCAAGMCTNRDAQCYLQTKSNQQAELNSLTSCSFDNTCQLMCERKSSSTSATSNCVIMQTSVFYDGTECGLGGRCQNGECNGSNIFNAALRWIKLNKSLAIGIGCALGVLLLGCIYMCCIRRCINNRTRKENPMPLLTRQQSMLGNVPKPNIPYNSQDSLGSSGNPMVSTLPSAPELNSANPRGAYGSNNEYDYQQQYNASPQQAHYSSTSLQRGQFQGSVPSMYAEQHQYLSQNISQNPSNGKYSGSYTNPNNNNNNNGDSNSYYR